jgi:type I restriction enzyme R subunit
MAQETDSNNNNSTSTINNNSNNFIINIREISSNSEKNMIALLSSNDAVQVKKVLTTNLEESAKVEAQLEEDEQDLIDRIEDEMKKRGSQRNLSYYAFTATPKKKTLRLFGTKDPDENYVPFDLYSMKQAIEEGFILDVLKNYTTYERHFMLIKIAAEDKVVEGKKASRALMNYIDLHHLNLSNKAKLIVEHFRLHTLSTIGGLAKAMVISSSRLQAFRYKQEIDEYVRSKKYQNIKTLVAFSGSIKDDLGTGHTEQSINNIQTEGELRDKFDTSEFNILIVAEKYQTGYNQPLLHTMYVDRKLRGIKVVQTLSRLNRTHPGKTDTFVIDFQNMVSEITNEFEPFYKTTVLIDKTNPTYLFNLYSEIIHYDIIRERELEIFAAIFFKPRSIHATSDLGKLNAVIDPVLDRFYSVKEMDQDKFKEKLIEYIEAYSFLTQIIPYDDTKLEKLFVVAKFIANENILKGIGLQIPELKGDVSLKWYRLEKTHEGNIIFGDSERPLIVGDSFSTGKSPDIVTTLYQVIQEFNERFSGDVRITDADTIVIEEWIKSLENDVSLRDIAQANEFNDFLRVFESKREEQYLIPFLLINSWYQKFFRFWFEAKNNYHCCYLLS